MSNKAAHTPKTPKNNLNKGDWHASRSSMGMGDYYGTGIRNPMGKMKEGVGQQYVNHKQLKTPPKNLA